MTVSGGGEEAGALQQHVEALKGHESSLDRDIVGVQRGVLAMVAKQQSCVGGAFCERCA